MKPGTCLNSIMFGDAMAYFYSKRPEKKFYILCQDYLFGHEMATGFKAVPVLYTAPSGRPRTVQQVVA